MFSLLSPALHFPTTFSYSCNLKTISYSSLNNSASQTANHRPTVNKIDLFNVWESLKSRSSAISRKPRSKIIELLRNSRAMEIFSYDHTNMLSVSFHIHLLVSSEKEIKQCASYCCGKHETVLLSVYQIGVSPIWVKIDRSEYSSEVKEIWQMWLCTVLSMIPETVHHILTVHWQSGAMNI